MILFIIVLSFFSFTSAREIPNEYKKDEAKLILQSKNYVEPSRTFSDNVISNPVYKDDLINFYESFIDNNEISSITKAYLLFSLIRLGELKYLDNIIKLKVFNDKTKSKEYKLYFLGQVYLSLHKEQRNITYNLDGISSFNTNSFESYKDPRYTPDYAFDGDAKSYWKINNISDVNENMLKIHTYFKNFTFKLYCLESLNGNNLPIIKTLKIQLIGGESRKIIREKEYSIYNNTMDKEHIFKSGLLEKYFENDERYYIVKITILDYHKAEKSVCYIPEIQIKSIK